MSSTHSTFAHGCLAGLAPPSDSAPYTNWTISRYCWETIQGLLRPGWMTLECGSGLSTLLFDAVGCRHTALEHDPRHCAGSRSVKLTPLVGDPPWYDWTSSSRFDFIFIDGPPGRIGRAGIRHRIAELMHDDTIVVLDDTHRAAEYRLCSQLANDFSLDGFGFPGWRRSFTILWSRKSTKSPLLSQQLAHLKKVPLATRPAP